MSLVATISDPSWESKLGTEALRDLDYWRAVLEPAMRHQGRGVDPILQQIAANRSLPYKTIRNRFNRWKAEGLHGLVDKRLAGPLFWKVLTSTEATPVSRSRGMQELWRKLCEDNQRKCKPAHKVLVKMWQRRDAAIGAIAEYADFPGWPDLPAGLSYENLMRYGPTEFELAATRQGRAAAAAKRPTVFATRVGCYPGSHYIFDDKWNDLFVNSFAEKQHGRPLEVYSLDYFAALKLCNAVRVRTRDEAGKYKGIAEVMTRYVVAETLFSKGYSPRGTILVAEHGTAAIREKVAQFLYDSSGGLITLSESGMTGEEVAHLGQYPGLSKGNFRHKAALEANNNLEHNVRGALPGQTGMSVETRPEQLHGILDYNAKLLALLDKLPPEKAKLLEFPLLEINQYMNLASHLDAEIAMDRDHELEGWIEAGNVVQSFQIGGKDILETDLTPEQRLAIVPMLQANLLQSRPLRMSRREVWERGAGELTKLPGWGVCGILGDDLARETTVRSGMIEIQDQDIGPGTYRFESLFRDAEGRAGQLRDGEKYQVFVNPFALGVLFARDAKGRYVGECRRIHAPSRLDIEGVRRAQGTAVHMEAELLAPIVARHEAEAREKTRMHKANAAVVDNKDAQPVKTTAGQRDRNAERAAALARRSEQMNSQGKT